jgi:hypothetical protein
MEPVTRRPVGLSAETWIEFTATAIACVLSDAYQGMHDLPVRPLTLLDPAIRQIYEAIGRATAHSLLLPDRKTTAERRAVEAAADILEHYHASDEGLGVRVDPDLRRKRLTTAFLSALHTYQREMAREAV